MKRYRPAAVLILLLSLRLQAQRLTPEIQKLLDVKQRTRALLSDVPNYSCLETVDRSWQQFPFTMPQRDVLHVQVSVDKGQESFAAPGSRSTVTENLARLSERGLTATGLFSLFASDLFTARDAAIYGAESNARVLRYDFHVPSGSSGWRLASGGGSARVGERGSFTVDAHSLRLLSMDVIADEIPTVLPFLSVRISIDYSAGMVSGVPSLVPSSAEMWAKERSGELHHDRFFFSQCRRFSAASTVYFEGGAAGALLADGEHQGLTMLPGGLTIPVKLLASVDSTNAMPGDPIRAATTRDVIWKGKLLIRNGTAVEGHIRAGAGREGPNAHGVAIEFDRVATEGGSADFLAQFESGSLGEGANQGLSAFDEKGGAPPSRMYFARWDVPGVVSFFKLGDRPRLPAGMKMVWKVQDLRQVRNVLHGTDRQQLGTDPRFFGQGSPLYPY